MFDVRKMIIYLLQSYSLHIDISRREIIYYLNYMNLCETVSWLNKNVLPSAKGGGANASFLYLLLNVLIKFQPKRILELGSGLTTKLLSQYAEKNSIEYIKSIDHDRFWIETIQKEICERIELIYAPLVKNKINNISFDWYDIEHFSFDNIQLLIIDGPPAYMKNIRNNRYGSIDLLDKIDKGSYVIIVDDSYRKGERKLVEDIKKELPGDALMGRVYGTTTQTVFLSPDNKEYLYL